MATLANSIKKNVYTSDTSDSDDETTLNQLKMKSTVSGSSDPEDVPLAVLQDVKRKEQEAELNEDNEDKKWKGQVRITGRCRGTQSIRWSASLPFRFRDTGSEDQRIAAG
jgi:hypothetical protein